MLVFLEHLNTVLKLVFSHLTFLIDCFPYVRHVSGDVETTFFPNLLLINSHLRAVVRVVDVTHMSALYRVGLNLELT